jgi:hydrogenase maturation protein HypF
MGTPGEQGTHDPRQRRRVFVRGVVQGVGFRPFVYTLARTLGLSGAVWNTGEGVTVEVEGHPDDVAAFVDGLGREAPPLSSITEIGSTEVPLRGGTEFTITGSEGRPGRTFVSPDVATCPECLADLRDPAGRRYRHPFVTCTNCGPRFTIITGLPYDRPATTMAAFAMCPECAREYADPADRRFHAQPICCPGCGPGLALTRPGRTTTHGEEAMREARRLVAHGAVLAVKGLGGYHLACDATDEGAVATLRKRKQRGDKPFAVMVRDVGTADRVAALTPLERALLAGHHRPIVLATARDHDGVHDSDHDSDSHDDQADRLRLADAVAPGSADVGLLLPYTPVHHLLLGLPGDPPGPPALVMTSGNLTGEPIVTDDAEARNRLTGLVDAWLTHDRPIHVPCDDSVVRVVDEVELPVRRSRGFAPLPLTLPFEVPPALAVGGDLKNTFCLAEGRLAWMSAHVGDMDDLATQGAFAVAEQHLEALTGVRPGALACDLHPGYRTRRWAEQHAAERPVTGVQHHHAHVASTMAEHGLDGSRRVLGVAFDGTGYGDDGAVWGGEFLVADYRSYERVAHLGYVPLPGGDAGVRNPCRMALSHLRAAGLPWDPDLPCVAACSPEELRLLRTQLSRGLRCAPTSSMGRLFDAVASVAGVCHRVGYEAQAAMELESRARRTPLTRRYAFGIEPTTTGPWTVDADPVLAAVADDVRAGTLTATVAAGFHAAVVDLVVEVAERVRAARGIDTVTLSGGVFLNALLTHGCRAALVARGFEVLCHRRVPPSDAGLALGQVAVLAHLAPGDGQDRSVSDQRPVPRDEEMPCA